jgi:hypothetical protein
MQHLAKDVVRMLGLAICMELTSLAASAQTAPKAPTNLCIAGAVCVAATATPATPSPPPPAPSAPASKGAHKWNPGYYVRATAAHGFFCGTDCDANRHSRYAQILSAPDDNIKGFNIWIDWKYLESDAGNDFTAGISWMTNELAYVAKTYPGKKVGILLNISPYGYTGLTGAPNTFPQYFIDAGCVYNEDSAAASGGQSSLNWYKNNPTCLGYFTRMMNAYGAALDSNSTLAFIRVQQETDDAFKNAGISATDEDTAWKNIAQVSTTAFPTTPIWIPVNWVGVETPANKEALILYYKSIGAGVGSADTQPPALSYPCPSTSLPCVIRGMAGAGSTGHDNCGESLVMMSVELSEMGYNTVADPPGGLTSAQVANSWNNDYCAHFGIWEPNFGEIGSSDTQYWYGAHGQKWAIDNIPVTHTAKPAGYL